MPVITIPFDYDERTHPEIVPICVEDRDREGRLIHPDWFRLGVAPAADDLRRLAKRVLFDTWKASEIADNALKSAVKRNGDKIGPRPDLIIRSNAGWVAETLKVGDRRVRSGKEVELFDTTAESLQDRADLESQAQYREMLEKLVRQARALGLEEAADMVPMMLEGCFADEYIQRFGKRRNTLTQSFFRSMRKAARTAGITG